MFPAGYNTHVSREMKRGPASGSLGFVYVEGFDDSHLGSAGDGWGEG